MSVKQTTDYGSKQNNVSYDNRIDFYVHNNVICNHFGLILHCYTVYKCIYILFIQILEVKHLIKQYLGLPFVMHSLILDILIYVFKMMS